MSRTWRQRQCGSLASQPDNGPTQARSKDGSEQVSSRSRRSKKVLLEITETSLPKQLRSASSGEVRNIDLIQRLLACTLE